MSEEDSLGGSSKNADILSAPIFGLSRHRLAVDGDGVTTLVAFHGCPLRCRYCLNDVCHDPRSVRRRVTPRQLVDELAIDNIYFLATGGGVCFGGGEPLLHSAFIEAFAKTRPPEWKITVETSLNVPITAVERVNPYIDHYIVDIKDCNPEIYRGYTDGDVSVALANLRWLLSHKGMIGKLTVRLPHIPDYNSPTDVARSRATLAEMGVVDFDEFHYQKEKRRQ